MIRKTGGEALGSLLLTACVVGSGIMAERLAGGNGAIALLANTLATVAGLATLIMLFCPISGAHFNPMISAAAFVARQIDGRTAAMFAVAQIAGCCAGAILANAMFELPLVDPSSHVRTGTGQWLSEFVATAGLVFIAFRSGSVTEASI
jgi:glycerol uptake facilitator-like aquaporin